MPIPFLLAVNGDNTSPRAENRWALRLRLRLRLRDGKQFRYGKPPTGAWCELVLVSLSIVTGGSDGGVTAERNENGCTCVTGATKGKTKGTRAKVPLFSRYVIGIDRCR